MPARPLRLLLALAASLALLVPAAAPVQAATFSFSSPDATSRFDQAITFTVQLTAGAPTARVDVEIETPGDIGPYVETLPNTPGAGTSTLHYSLDTSGSGHVIPNTLFTVTWVAYPQGGGAPTSSSPFSYRYSDDTQHWQTLRDGIVTVHWTTGSTSFATNAASVAVKAITSVAKVLGVSETQPVDFFIYADDASFRAALGPSTRENVAGSAIPEIRTLFGEVTPAALSDPYTTIVISHELTHLVVYDATDNPYRSLPRWLNEGFAVYESEGFSTRFRSALADGISSGDLLPLTALGWQFPTEYDKTALAYAESVSAVDLIARQYGVDALVKLILAYKDGPTDDEALQSAIGMDMAAFQSAWFQSIGAPVPSQFGPQPAPSGPLPSGWTASASAPPASSPPSTSGASSAAPSGIALATPSATEAPGGAGSSSSGDLTLVLAAIVVVSAAVLAGIVLASRRTQAP